MKKILLFLFATLIGCTAQGKNLQHTDTVIMISPDHFAYNPLTAETNSFQHQSNDSDLKTKAVISYQRMVKDLKKNGIRVVSIPSVTNAITPEAVFPNNWFSVHHAENGKNILVVYPMLVTNRRPERQVETVINNLKKININIDEIIDLSHYENDNLALEGTGSLVLDRVNKVAFASLSPRTEVPVINEFLKKLNYSEAILFRSYTEQNQLIYHTNVMLSIGSKFAVIAANQITDQKEREKVIAKLKSLNKEIIYISADQMKKMAANILEVASASGKPKIILSKTAYNAFTKIQRQQLKKFGDLVPVNIDVIEHVGGGSARCMLAEVFYR